MLHSRGFKGAAWLCILLLAVLSLIPGHVQVRSGMPGGYEHAIAYFGTATMFMLGYSRKNWEIAGGLASYSVLLEMLQFLVPGRTPHIADAFASSSGAILGVIVWMILLEQKQMQSASPLVSRKKSDLDFR
ncbi:VanZ like family protein [Microvirga guangxiensis]|uniref:VanZ like family protein n=2 Tax=Microvirga guangxiensis TaxID=549386 RepID=A0A1G5I729_9HYPH|nr:VanZ like family protein [Microvirga guangxiensis]